MSKCPLFHLPATLFLFVFVMDAVIFSSAASASESFSFRQFTLPPPEGEAVAVDSAEERDGRFVFSGTLGNAPFDASFALEKPLRHEHYVNLRKTIAENTIHGLHQEKKNRHPRRLLESKFISLYASNDCYRDDGPRVFVVGVLFLRSQVAAVSVSAEVTHADAVEEMAVEWCQALVRNNSPETPHSMAFHYRRDGAYFPPPAGMHDRLDTDPTGKMLYTVARFYPPDGRRAEGDRGARVSKIVLRFPDAMPMDFVEKEFIKNPQPPLDRDGEPVYKIENYEDGWIRFAYVRPVRLGQYLHLLEVWSSRDDFDEEDEVLAILDDWVERVLAGNGNAKRGGQ